MPSDVVFTPAVMLSETVRMFPIGPLLRYAEELYQPRLDRELAVRLSDARVVVADHALLQADFPYLSDAALGAEHPELAALDEPARRQAIHALLDAWLLEHAGLISKRQTDANEVNTPIPTTGVELTVVRPPRYGRALISMLPRGGLLDLKGAGIAAAGTPGRRIHQSGLMFLGEALADLAHQRVIDRMFRHAGSSFWSVPTYAVLDLGFGLHVDLPGEDGGQQAVVMPAGMQVRRAHRRPTLGGDLPGGGTAGQRVKFEIEMILRHFGVTSCNVATRIQRYQDEAGVSHYRYAGGPMDDFTLAQRQAIDATLGAGYDAFEGVNVQLSREVIIGPSAGQVVDFGHYEVRRRFELPVVSLVADRLLRWGGALRPEHPHFIQPAPELCLPLDEWEVCPDGQRLPGLPGTSRQTPVDQRCFELARLHAARELERASLCAELDALVDRATARWWTGDTEVSS